MVHRRLTWSLAGLLLLGSATACSDESSGADDPGTRAEPESTSTASASPAANPTESGPPRPPKQPRATDTAAGRRAFAEFVVAAWGHALRTNDAGPVTGLSPAGQPCQGCKELAAELRKRKKQGWYVDFPGAEVRRVVLGGAGAPATYLARATVDIPRSISYFDDGTFRNDNDAHRGATFEVRMRFDKKRWSLLAFRLT